MSKALAELQKAIGYRFHDEGLLQEALAHRSQAAVKDDQPFNNQRLEFLGDAVLGNVVAHVLYTQYAQDAEGDLSRKLVALVKGETLTKIAKNLALNFYLSLSESEEKQGGRNTASNLEDALEALIGAIYLDGGIAHAQAFVQRHWHDEIQNLTQLQPEPKTALQEHVQARGLPLPQYSVIEETGAAHAPIFTVKVAVRGAADAIGMGANKKQAEREAASNMLAQLK
jgi:ribonuclease-3